MSPPWPPQFGASHSHDGSVHRHLDRLESCLFCASRICSDCSCPKPFIQNVKLLGIHGPFSLCFLDPSPTGLPRFCGGLANQVVGQVAGAVVEGQVVCVDEVFGSFVGGVDTPLATVDRVKFVLDELGNGWQERSGGRLDVAMAVAPEAFEPAPCAGGRNWVSSRTDDSSWRSAKQLNNQPNCQF